MSGDGVWPEWRGIVFGCFDGMFGFGVSEWDYGVWDYFVRGAVEVMRVL